MEPTTLIYTGLILIFLFFFGYAGYYFIRNTIKEKNWLMFWYVGLIALAVLLMFVYTTFL